MMQGDMRRRLYFAAVLLISFASVATATFVAMQKMKPTAKSTAQKSSTTAAGQKAPAPKGGANPAGAGPIRPVDPNRAPQKLVDEALYTNEDFFEVSASVARPYIVALERVNALEAQYPKDPRLRLHSAGLAERLGQ